MASEAALRQEAAWATHVAVPAVLLPPIPRRHPCVNYARVVNQLREHGRCIRAHYGVKIVPVPPALRAHFDLRVLPGEIVKDIKWRPPEKKAKLKCMPGQRGALLTLYAAWKIDKAGALASMTEISAIKVVAPNVLEQAVSEAIQIHGAAGLSDDVPLVAILGGARALRLADGPDAVHRGVIARMELGKYAKLMVQHRNGRGE